MVNRFLRAAGLGFASAYGRGLHSRLAARVGGRRVSGKPSSFRGRRVMRAVGFNRSRNRVFSGRRSMRPEKHKRLVHNAISTTITHDTGTVTPILLTDIDQGVDNENRTGDIIVLKRLYGKLFFAWNPSEATILQSTFRVIIIQFKNRIAAAPVISDFLESTTFGTISLYQLKNNMDADEHYKILLDRYFVLNKFPTAVASGLYGHGRNNMLMKINIRLNSRIHYLNATGSNLGRGMIFMYVFSGQDMTDDPTFAGQLRLTYMDV